MNVYIAISLILIVSGSIHIGKALNAPNIPLVGFISLICGLLVIANNFGLI